MSLPATIGKSYPTNPFPCGVTKTVTAGTAVQASHNFTDLATRKAKWISIRGLDTNTGSVYVIVEQVGSLPPWTLAGGGTTSGADTSNYLNVVQILSAGETWGISSEISNQLAIGQIWIDTSVSGEGAIVTVYEY